MPNLRRTSLATLLLCFLGLGLHAQTDKVKWSPWRPIDENFPGVRIRTSVDDNDGRGWADGSHRWLFEVKNTLAKSTVRVALSFAQKNPRTKNWEAPTAALPAGFELEPGDVHEGMAMSPEKESFDYRYAIAIAATEGKTPTPARLFSGLANSRIVTKPIAESSLIANAAMVAAMADERKINGDMPAAIVEGRPTKIITIRPAKAAPVATEPAAASTPAAPPTNLPMNAPPLPPASVEGLDAAAKFTLWQQRANQGDVASMFELGLACRYGQGTPQDHVAATEWYRQAAIRGHAEAMTKLGFAYDSGLGVERNEITAIEWWQKAASHGEPDALKKLAKLGVAPVSP